jgi:hypothetical protein
MGETLTARPTLRMCTWTLTAKQTQPFARLMGRIKESPRGDAAAAMSNCSYDLIFYDVKQDSEYASNAIYRACAARAPYYTRAIRAAIMSNCADAWTLAPNAMFLIHDGFHPNSHGLLRDGFLDSRHGVDVDDSEEPAHAKGKTRKKPPSGAMFVKPFHLIYSEETFKERRERTGGGFQCIDQLETVLCVSAADPRELRSRSNQWHVGTTCGQGPGILRVTAFVL